LRDFAREHEVTINTVVQGAWALLLSAYSGDDDVVYGAALSGRPPSLTNVTRIPGMFINTLPIRVVIDPDLSVRRWLGRLQEQQVELREYEYSPLTQVQGWSQIARSVPLFDVIVTFQNFPVDRTLIEEAARSGLDIELVLSQEQSTAPLTVFLALEGELTVRFAYDPGRFDERTIAGVAERYLHILKGIISNGEASVLDLQIGESSEAPRLPTMAIPPPSAEELKLLGLLTSWDADTESDPSHGKD
jgi:non-ribosomal peptide synthetase component F